MYIHIHSSLPLVSPAKPTHTYTYTHFCFYLIEFFITEGLSQEPRRVKEKLLFLPKPSF